MCPDFLSIFQVKIAKLMSISLYMFDHVWHDVSPLLLFYIQENVKWLNLNKSAVVGDL